MTLQLAGDIHLRNIRPVAPFYFLGQHQFRHGTGILFHAALEEFNPFIVFAKLLIAGLQHFKRFAHQFTILADNFLQALYRFRVLLLIDIDTAHHDGDARTAAVRRRAFPQQRHRFIGLVVGH